jgi:hypothetical protein
LLSGWLGHLSDCLADWVLPLDAAHRVG